MNSTSSSTGVHKTWAEIVAKNKWQSNEKKINTDIKILKCQQTVTSSVTCYYCKELILPTNFDKNIQKHICSDYTSCFMRTKASEIFSHVKELSL